jgi:lipopolysaccharide/colanic/teichoic acid biosynthesis glycosyltransferase
VAILLRLTDPGPIFYGHKRVGLGGKSFRLPEIPHHVHRCGRVLQRLLASDPGVAAEWNATRKLRHDPRISRVGRVLRAYSVDELPQLINVIRGEMSLVGPRPVVTSELTRYGNAAVHYLSARPGITGLWQVSGRSDTTYRARVSLDAHYVTGGAFRRHRHPVAHHPRRLGARGSC